MPKVNPKGGGGGPKVPGGFSIGCHFSFFWSENHEINFFLNFFIAKGSYIVSKPNDDFHEASFEVYYISVSQGC